MSVVTHTPMSECLDLALLHLTSHMHSASLARASVLRTPRLRAYYCPPTMINGGSPRPVHAIPHAQSSLLNQQFVTHPLTQVACATPPNRIPHALSFSRSPTPTMAPSCRSILLGASMAAALMTGGNALTHFTTQPSPPLAKSHEIEINVPSISPPSLAPIHIHR
jgi:hypothetical protein